ncbi:hypothetical protein JTB14_017889 [Gonioctena quinquepunctata]|nr:hypothetical protein JTB14_017889 [Gonioctena quinquepunctata]
MSTTVKLEWGKKVSSLNIKTGKLNISDFSEWFAEIATAACCVVSHPDTDKDRKKKCVCAANGKIPIRKFNCLYCKLNDHSNNLIQIENENG